MKFCKVFPLCSDADQDTPKSKAECRWGSKPVRKNREREREIERERERKTERERERERARERERER